VKFVYVYLVGATMPKWVGYGKPKKKKKKRGKKKKAI
tara:strand:+ start:371 stop:481 length:111 start_codon:yes stop_codon:yes gene_type:complete